MIYAHTSSQPVVLYDAVQARKISLSKVYTCFVYNCHPGENAAQSFFRAVGKLGDGSLDGAGDVLLRRIGVVTVVQEDLQVGTFGGVTLPTNHMHPHQANNIQSGRFRSQFKSSQVSYFIPSQS